MSSAAVRRSLPLLALSLAACEAAADAPVPARSEAPPFALEDVDFTADCSPNAALDRLLGLLLPKRMAERDDAVPEFDEPLFNATAGAVSRELHLGREAPWHGLRLVGVRTYHGIESGPSNLSLVFADGPERVREVWNGRGWNLPPANQTRVVEDEEVTTAVGLESDRERTAVTCFVD